MSVSSARLVCNLVDKHVVELKAFRTLHNREFVAKRIVAYRIFQRVQRLHSIGASGVTWSLMSCGLYFKWRLWVKYFLEAITF